MLTMEKKRKVVLPFELGQVFVHQKLVRRVCKTGDNLNDYLKRHSTGHWGQVDDDIEKLNVRAARLGIGFVLSKYRTKDGRSIEVLTILCADDEPITLIRRGIPEGEINMADYVEFETRTPAFAL